MGCRKMRILPTAFYCGRFSLAKNDFLVNKNLQSPIISFYDVWYNYRYKQLS